RLHPLAREIEQGAQPAGGVLAPDRAASAQFVEIATGETPAEDVAGGTEGRLDRAAGGQRGDRERLPGKTLGNHRLAFGAWPDGLDDPLTNNEAGSGRLGLRGEDGLPVLEVRQLEPSGEMVEIPGVELGERSGIREARADFRDQAGRSHPSLLASSGAGPGARLSRRRGPARAGPQRLRWPPSMRRRSSWPARSWCCSPWPSGRAPRSE